MRTEASPTPGELLRQRIEAEADEAGGELDGREQHLLDLAVVAADNIAALEEVVAAEGVTSTGARGQTVIHPALSEARQQKLVLARLLSGIDLVGNAAAPGSASARAAKAARASHGTRASIRSLAK